MGWEEAGHLPQLRDDGLPPDPAGLPRQRRGKTPQMIGRYPDYDCLENRDHWDQPTREVVMARVEKVPPIRFFDAREERAARAFCDCVMAQDREPRIPVLNFIDEKLHEGKLDGFQHQNMPDDREVWRVVAGKFADLDLASAPMTEQHAICGRFADGDLELPFDTSTAWSVVMRYVLQAFYSHPWAWNEIGFGGPAYPRGYLNPGINAREKWEVADHHDVDPIPFVARTERARRAHNQLTGAGDDE
jgi:hypothetical protein